MPRDTQILRSAPEAAPKDYPIDQHVELILRQVHAHFTDNGAASDWLPCVDLISDSGHRIARCADPNVKVTAGDDADASWFPDVKPAGGSIGTGTAKWCRVALGAVQPSGVITNPSGGTAMPILSFSTNSADFTQVDAHTFSLPANAPLVLSGYMQQDGGAPVTTNGDVLCSLIRSGGVAIGPFAGNGTKVVDEFYGQTLARPLEIGGNWTAFATGSDTHFWDLVATFFGVF